MLSTRLAHRLTQEFNDHFTLNYHMRSISGASTSPYPDDLDDTFCGLSALYIFDKQRLDGNILAQATLALTACEVEPGGPYRTWLVSDKAAPSWRDVDPVVNANIAYFLQLHGLRLPKLDSYLTSHISLPASPYYPSPLHVGYFLARALQGTVAVQDLAKTLLACRPTNILELALLTTSLLRCGAVAQAQNLIPPLLQEIGRGRAFEALPFCIDTVRGGVKHFAGCSELTAALCIEALDLLVQTDNASKALRSANSLNITPTVLERVKNHLFDPTDTAFTLFTDTFITKLTNIKRVDDITALPYHFAHAWSKSTQQLDHEHLLNLSAAHVLGWIAYTLYDNIIDHDGVAVQVSLANLAHRQMERYFYSLPLDPTFFTFVDKTLNGMDRANAWELLHARLPTATLPVYTLDKLSDRSFGIAIAPVALLRLAGHSQTSREVTAVLTFFQHYLAAKQLNDDAHDWQDDLEHGHITSVVTQLLAQEEQPYTAKLLPQLQATFWDNVIVKICADIQLEINQARQCLDIAGPILAPDFFENLLGPLEHSAAQALDERQRSLAFLATMQAAPRDT